MAFSTMAFTPVDGLSNTTSYPTQPTSETEIRAAIQGISDQLRDFINNTLLVEIAATTADASGASNIGAETVGDLSGNTVQALLEALNAAILALSVSASGLVDGVVQTSYLADDAVTNAKVADDAIDTAQLADGAVETAIIADDAVTQAKIAAGAVGATELADGGVSSTKLASGAVTEGKIGSAAVTEGKIGTGAVTEEKIGTGAVTATKLASTAVVSKHCKAYKTASQTISGSTIVTFPNEEYDTDTMHDNSTNPGRITIKTAGVYVIHANLSWNGVTDETLEVEIQKNGTRVALSRNYITGISEFWNEITYIGEFAVNDYVEVQAYNAASCSILGTDLGKISTFTAARIGAIS